ncbi:hypothetical protein GW17_00019373, partial [Ensete ventricosum]
MAFTCGHEACSCACNLNHSRGGDATIKLCGDCRSPSNWALYFYLLEHQTPHLTPHSLFHLLLLLLLIVIIIATIARTWRTKKTNNQQAQLPAGSRGWPLVGETLHFVSSAYSPRPERFMDKRRLMYGKVFRSHLFGSPTIVSTDAEVSRRILQSDASSFVPWYPKSLTELMGKSSILLINGNLQRRVHGLIGAFFKSPDLKAQITGDMQRYAQESMAKWKDHQLIHIQDETKNV